MSDVNKSRPFLLTVPGILVMAAMVPVIAICIFLSSFRNGGLGTAVQAPPQAKLAVADARYRAEDARACAHSIDRIDCGLVTIDNDHRITPK